MAWLKKWFISKAEYVMLVTIWNAIAVFIPLHFHWSIETVVLIITVGNAIIAWVGTNTESETAS